MMKMRATLQRLLRFGKICACDLNGMRFSAQAQPRPAAAGCARVSPNSARGERRQSRDARKAGQHCPLRANLNAAWALKA
eukprot:5389642-Pleurochrysis_carterae.AAC.2